MRILGVDVENFRRHEALSLELGGDALALVAGPNMSGKTTVMDAIHLAYETVLNNKSPRIRAGLDPTDPLLRPRRNEPLVITMRFAVSEDEYAALREVEASLGGTLRVDWAEVYSFRLRIAEGQDGAWFQIDACLYSAMSAPTSQTSPSFTRA